MEVCLLAHFAATVTKKKGTGLQQQRPQRRPPCPAVRLVVAVEFMEVQVAQVLAEHCTTASVLALSYAY